MAAFQGYINQEQALSVHEFGACLAFWVTAPRAQRPSSQARLCAGQLHLAPG